MGTTAKYGLRWPAVTGLVKDGAAAIRALAEDVEAALRAPLLVTDGDGTLNWSGKVAEVPWDVTDDPDRKRGGWSSAGNAERLVIPAAAGYYLVTTSVRLGGKTEADIYQPAITTRALGSEVGSGTVWSVDRRELPANADDYSLLNVASIVRVADASPAVGIAVRLSYAGANQPPATAAGINKLRIHRLSTL